MIRIDIPGLRTGRGQNDREHWRARARRWANEKAIVGWTLKKEGIDPPMPPLIVCMTRIAPSNGLDDDNLTGAMKKTRDTIADWLGIDDKDPRVQYRAAQERGAWAVRIEIESAEIAHAKSLIDGQAPNNPRRE